MASSTTSVTTTGNPTLYLKSPSSSPEPPAPAFADDSDLGDLPELVLDSFHQLVKDLADALGPCSGLDSADVDPGEIEDLMHNYKSKTCEWQPYALADYSRAYTRNLVDRGNGKSNLLILVWSPGRGSPIHDHANAHCVMKILRGELKETLYHWPDRKLLKDGIADPPVIKKETIFKENDVTYMSDQLGLHKIMNPDPEKVAVSLHLYTPPHAATRGCHIFDEKTGRPRKVMQCQFSEFGRRC